MRHFRLERIATYKSSAAVVLKGGEWWGNRERSGGTRGDMTPPFRIIAELFKEIIPRNLDCVFVSSGLTTPPQPRVLLEETISSQLSGLFINGANLQSRTVNDYR